MQTTTIERILSGYGVAYRSIGPVQKGYRNQSYAVTLADGSLLNLMVYKSEPGMLERIKRANRISDYLYNAGLPARHSAGTSIARLQAGTHVKYGALYHYLPGHTIPWEAYTQDHIKLLGKTMSDMHAALRSCSTEDLPDVTIEYRALITRMRAYFEGRPVRRALEEKLLLCIAPDAFDRLERVVRQVHQLPGRQPLHMDFVRSNILFSSEPAHDTFKVSISGILDFEKTACGHPLFDVGRTLAFLLVDCKYKTPDKVRKYFLGSGYIKRGAAVLPGKHLAALEPLLGLFLFHDLYKFLQHNPYESLPDNEHFVRTAEQLISRQLLRVAPSLVRTSPFGQSAPVGYV